MEILKSIVSDREGEIIGSCFKKHKYATYVKVPIKCKNNHIWNPNVSNLIWSQSWCPTCHRRTYKIDDLHEHAAIAGGKCLSTKYTNSTDKYKWQCGQCDCIWDATWASLIYMHSWCPNCCNSCRETIARLACEEYTGYPFVKTRDTLGYNAEIDLWCDELDFGFEIDGIQHTEFVPYFHITEEAFEAQKERDRKKDEAAKETGATLYRIPYTISINALRKFMYNFLMNVANVEPPEHELMSDDEFFALVTKTRTAKNKQYCDKINEILTSNNARAKGTLTCLSYSHKITLICENNHEFDTNFERLMRGCWCKHCAANAPLTYEIIKTFVESKNYELLSEYYATNIHDIKKMEDPSYVPPENTKPNISTRIRKFIKVKCPDKGHEPYLIMWDNFKKDAGCMKCGRNRTVNSRRKTSSDICNELEKFGLEMVSDYINVTSNAKFKCIKNHYFTSTLAKVRSNNKRHGCDIRCPICIMNMFKYIKLTDGFDQDTELSELNLKFQCIKCNKTFSKTFKSMQAVKVETCGKGH